MFRNEHGRSFLNDAVRGGRGTAGIKPTRIKAYSPIEKHRDKHIGFLFNNLPY